MPMPIPKSVDLSQIATDLHYLSFQEAQLLPFTNEHQPSLTSIDLRDVAKQRKTTTSQQLPASRVAQGPIITNLKNKSNFKIGVALKVQGVVECNRCHKPLCIYSRSAISRMKPPLPPPSLDDTPSEPLTSQQVNDCQAMVKDMLNDAVESTIFMCGMVALDLDDPCYDLFRFDPSLDCDTHVESEFYVSRIQPKRVVLCYHCAGTMLDSPIQLNTHLKAPEGPYSIVLPICKACIDSGCHIIVRSARREDKTPPPSKPNWMHATQEKFRVKR